MLPAAALMLFETGPQVSMLQEITPRGEMRDEHDQLVQTTGGETAWELGQRAAGHAGGAIILLTKDCWTDERFLGAVERLVGGGAEAGGAEGSEQQHLHIMWEADPRFRGEVRVERDDRPKAFTSREPQWIFTA